MKNDTVNLGFHLPTFSFSLLFAKAQQAKASHSSLFNFSKCFHTQDNGKYHHKAPARPQSHNKDTFQIPIRIRLVS